MPVLAARAVPTVLRTGGSARVAADIPARFAPGDRVTVRNLNPPGHTRAPRYIRCKTGTIAGDHGVFVFPDTHAHGLGPRPQHVYSVRFTAGEVWGEEDAPNHAVYVDLWDDYLLPA